MENLFGYRSFLLTLVTLFSLQGYSAVLSENNPFIFGTPDQDNIGINKSLETSYDITLGKKNALEQRFLFTAAKIGTFPVSLGSSWASKVIFFERRGMSLYMFESLDGKMATEEVDTKILLAEFPIKNETEEFLTIDFKKGMNALFMKGSMYYGSNTDNVITVDQSFINKVELRGKYLFIDQYVRIKEENLRMKYTISSYVLNKDFKPKKTSDLKKVGYFVNHPLVNPLGTASYNKNKIYILKHDINKKVTYYISQNVPKEYKEAVAGGVLYWNQVFGKEVLEVKDLPKNIGVHEPGHHIVKWVDWKTAGFAYANISGDPLTGENLQSHVYMTSSFAVGGLKSAKRILRRLKKDKKVLESNIAFGLKGFKEANVCNYNLSESYQENLHLLIKTVENLSETKQTEIFNRFSSDYIREVMAHEVGHTMGLRHNFAGSLSANIKGSKWQKLWQDYFLKDEIPEDLITTSTVMDYTPIFISAMAGAHIRKNRGPLPYDKAAIEWGYTEKKVSEIEFPIFCTDDHAGKFLDCKRFDKFSNIMEGVILDWQANLDSLPHYWAERFFNLYEKEQDVAEPVDMTALTMDQRLEKLKRVPITPASDAKWLITKIGLLLEMASEKGKFLKIKRQYPFLSAFNQEEYETITSSYKERTFKKFGGLKKLFFELFTPKGVTKLEMVSNMEKKFHKLLTLNKNPIIQLEEKELIKKRMTSYMTIFEKELLLQFGTLLQKKDFAFYEEGIEISIKNLIETVVFDKSDKLLFATDSGEPFMAPKYEYSRSKVDLRGTYVSISQNTFYADKPSFNRKMKRLQKELFEAFTTELTMLKGETSYDGLTDDLFDWIYNEAKRFYPLAPKAQRPDILEYI